MADTSQAQNETPATQSDAEDQLRRALADVYTFVRGREVNRAIAGFTLDHYIDEAKRRIKGDSSSSRDVSLGARPTQLAEIDAIEQAFKTAFDQAQKLAQKNQEDPASNV